IPRPDFTKSGRFPQWGQDRCRADTESIAVPSRKRQSTYKFVSFPGLGCDLTSSSARRCVVIFTWCCAGPGRLRIRVIPLASTHDVTAVSSKELDGTEASIPAI